MWIERRWLVSFPRPARYIIAAIWMSRVPHIARENQPVENFLLGAICAVCCVLVAIVLRLGRASLQSIDAWEARLRERRSMRRWLTRRGWSSDRRF